MVRPAPILAEFADERRASPRRALSIPARLELPGGARWVEVIDLSDRGARLRLASPPPVGAAALLKWQSHEVFALIVWTEKTECGLRFEQALTDVAVSSVPCSSARLKPVATLDKIRVGARRRKAIIIEQDEQVLHHKVWIVPLRRPTGGGLPIASPMPPAEEMFFYGAPLAHVVQFAEHIGRNVQSGSSIQL